MKLWGGRFTKPTNQLVEEYTASISFDQKMWRQDIVGSLAHVAMLGKCGILPMEEVRQIIAGLKKVKDKIERGQAEFLVAHEDVHMNIEKMLIEEIGPVGGKLHTGRSRNDQVALDMHLYLREKLMEIIQLAMYLQEAMLAQASQHLDTVMPGYTHLQRAQPVLFGYHLMAYVSMLQRDIERMTETWNRVNVLPLGAGALAGTTFPIDRTFVAEMLQFDGIYQNSMDAVSDRDFIVEFLADASLLMTHLSRLCEELVIWSSQEFSFVELDDAFCTGSSIMPQKKNPDVAELVRGKTGRVYGNLFGLLTVLKGLPLAYNKDMQEDKEGMFDTVATIHGALALLTPMIQTMQVRTERMRQAVTNDFSNATDLADYLVRKNMPFRQAHEVVGRTVLYCIEQQKYLLDLTLEEFQSFSGVIGADVYDALAVETVVNARNVLGGTARNQVEAQIAWFQNKLKETHVWVDKNSQKVMIESLIDVGSPA
ncbi:MULTISPECIES: argininosuccinate lyase [Brevibacillus]|jgi:argininosuccinate lyase|uniref:Argininosuccinate lyase n=1 Tax=Brevibacillus parabrevis TaxID=54914 RepID=A0A4Y3PKV6_BREPA|nr:MULTISPECIES: argininosuccinate lyase [Brevibacillus]MBU8713707.1 argininosuccinate lyase [Brevibacillus parabrevis]MDH6350834.1 argininosuccinate lyase [Brevibacillus sp. 1238]MDR4997968.1 argininosuccinate lyase [Brevibacillus parabrevis]MED1726277.1 argininosuccinate lyase [Brevibacillus parabrevis]MED2256203.1 argininosuccinate lyase [Brevibacillus parabrevis]